MAARRELAWGVGLAACALLREAIPHSQSQLALNPSRVEEWGYDDGKIHLLRTKGAPLQQPGSHCR